MQVLHVERESILKVENWALSKRLYTVNFQHFWHTAHKNNLEVLPNPSINLILLNKSTRYVTPVDLFYFQQEKVGPGQHHFQTTLHWPVNILLNLTYSVEAWYIYVSKYVIWLPLSCATQFKKGDSWNFDVLAEMEIRNTHHTVIFKSIIIVSLHNIKIRKWFYMSCNTSEYA